MSALLTFSNVPAPRPLPDVPVRVRPATLGDVPFIDGLQKVHSKQVGWMPTQQLEEKISAGNVLIAEEQIDSPTTVGYCIGQDRYFKRDDVGIIYQMNVIPTKQRGFVGATLLKALFDRSAYGCRLYCCWCAQDIQANYFWESLGFVPLAFRAGSAKRSRVHIFWQKRIRAGDVTTPWWYPSQTNAGAMMEDRLVLPIPPGTRWNDPMPIILPTEESTKSQASNHKQIESSKPKIQKKKEPSRPVTTSISAGGLRFANAPAKGPDEPPPPPPAPTGKAKKPKVKNDPKLIAAARELRDRWLEQINMPGANLLTGGKYDVSRGAELPDAQTKHLPPVVAGLLPAA